MSHRKPHLVIDVVHQSAARCFSINSNTNVPRKAPRRVTSSFTCARSVKLIGDYLAGDLSATDRTAFEAHYRACPDCLAFLKTYEKTMELTRSFLRQSSIRLESQR